MEKGDEETMGQLDLATKRLISYIDVFSDIINAIVYNGEQVLSEEYLRPYYADDSVPKDGGKLRGVYRDSCMEDVRDGIRYAIWGIENQNKIDYTMPFKIMGYDYAAYNRQIEEFGAQNKRNLQNPYEKVIFEEQKLSPVITIVLYYGAGELPCDIYSRINLPENSAVRKYVQNYGVNVVNLSQLTKEQVRMFKSDFASIAIALSKVYTKKEKTELIRGNSRKFVYTRDTMTVLGNITSDNRYFKIADERGEGEMKVCELADAFVEEGRKEGREEGREEGRKETRDEDIRKVVKRFHKMNLSDEDILKNIMEDYDLSEDEARAYLEESNSVSSNVDLEEDDFDRRLKDLEEFIHSQSEQ